MKHKFVKVAIVVLSVLALSIVSYFSIQAANDDVSLDINGGASAGGATVTMAKGGCANFDLTTNTTTNTIGYNLQAFIRHGSNNDITITKVVGDIPITTTPSKIIATTTAGSDNQTTTYKACAASTIAEGNYSLEIAYILAENKLIIEAIGEYEDVKDVLDPDDTLSILDEREFIVGGYNLWAIQSLTANGATCDFSAGDAPSRMNGYAGEIMSCILPPEAFPEGAMDEDGRLSNGTYELDIVITTAYDTIVFDDIAYPWYAYCIVAGTDVVLSADGVTKKIDDIQTGDEVLAWDFDTGQYVSSPVILKVSINQHRTEVMRLFFDDGSQLGAVSRTHALFDIDENKFVSLTSSNYSDYIGDSFYKDVFDGSGGHTSTPVKLMDVKIDYEDVAVYDLVTALHWNYVAEGFLNAQGFTELFDMFDHSTGGEMKYDSQKMASDIAKHGLYTFEELRDVILKYTGYEINELQFTLFRGERMKVSVGKGLISEQELVTLIVYYLTMAESV
ncbi:MAG: hypothetical protein LBK50_02855 [Candidatus Nomurabacteria bacterium]|nr:hypothetical protein [Candidatus Nomurabacteria bacterium]